ncbi:MAG: hypothetical protein KDK45_14805, partial [Leptospiraceae bacterium]|nr:hypothetical protein [Leptospiraceae bacterium]
EEPPEHSRFLFIVDDLSKLKQTIVSRGVCVPFAYIPPDKARELRQKYSLPTESFIGGNLNLFNAPAEVLSLIQTKVKETAFDPLLLLELENWVRNYKDKHPQWEDDFNYDSFLELFCLVLLNFYYEQDPKQYERKMEAIFTFKEELHKKIAGLEPYLLSRLFHSLSAS